MPGTVLAFLFCWGAGGWHGMLGSTQGQLFATNLLTKGNSLVTNAYLVALKPAELCVSPAPTGGCCSAWSLPALQCVSPCVRALW